MFNFLKRKPITEDLGFLQFVSNTIRSTLRVFSLGGKFGVSPDGKRNYNEIFGHIVDPVFEDFVGYYQRSPIASAIVNKMAKACWNERPEIFVNDEEILAEELKELERMGFFNALERADKLNRIGSFSVMVIGTKDDGLQLDMPVGSSRDMKNIYFRVYGQRAIIVSKFDMEPSSARFGLPILYQLTTIPSNEEVTTLSSPQITINVHWTRVIHLAEGALENELIGQSSLLPVLNLLTDLIKVGGSAEAFYRNARTQLAIEAPADVDLEADSDNTKKLAESIKEFTDGWGEAIKLKGGLTARNLPVQLISPRDTFDITIEQIAGQLGWPVRILTGKGAGQLAGSEDRATFGGLVLDRRNSWCTQWLLVGLGVLSEAGIFDLPDNATVKWQPSSPLTEKEEAEVGKLKAETLNIAADAMSKPMLMDADPNEVLDHLGIDDIEIDDSDIDDLGTDVDDGDELTVEDDPSESDLGQGT